MSFNSGSPTIAPRQPDCIPCVTMTTQTGSKIPVRPESVETIEMAASALDNLRGMVTTAELDLVYKSQPSDPGEETDSGIDGVKMPDTWQPTPVVPPRPQLKLMNPDRPVRYIPIHVWPEHLKKVQPRTGRRYSPKRSRTLQKRNGSSPLGREYRYTEDEGVRCEDQGLSDTETIESCDAESVDGSVISTTAKRRGWGYALLGAVQNAVPKRSREEKLPRTVIVPRKPLSLNQFRLGHHPRG